MVFSSCLLDPGLSYVSFLTVDHWLLWIYTIKSELKSKSTSFKAWQLLDSKITSSYRHSLGPGSLNIQNRKHHSFYGWLFMLHGTECLGGIYSPMSYTHMLNEDDRDSQTPCSDRLLLLTSKAYNFKLLKHKNRKRWEWNHCTPDSFHQVRPSISNNMHSSQLPLISLDALCICMRLRFDRSY